jgi:hypothetical protein
MITGFLSLSEKDGWRAPKGLYPADDVNGKPSLEEQVSPPGKQSAVSR